MEECLLMNIFPTGCPHGQGGRGGGRRGVSQMQTAADGEGGGGGSKISKNVRTPIMDGPFLQRYSFDEITSLIATRLKSKCI